MNQLAQARRASGMTQKELSAATGVDQAEISKIENGMANPSVSTLERLAAGMGRELNISFDIPAKDKLLKLEYFDKDKLCTTIVADRAKQSVTIRNHTEDVLHTAFGNNQAPTWQDFTDFLEERCVPRSRAGIRRYLDAIGVNEYDPLAIIRKTEGRLEGDQQWIKVSSNECQISHR